MQGVARLLTSAWVHLAHRFLAFHQPLYMTGPCMRVSHASQQFRGLRVRQVKAKAHNCRVLLAWCAGCAQSAPDILSEQGARRAACLHCLETWSRLVDESRSWRLTEPEAQALHEAGMGFLNCAGLIFFCARMVGCCMLVSGILIPWLLRGCLLHVHWSCMRDQASAPLPSSMCSLRTHVVLTCVCRWC